MLLAKFFRLLPENFIITVADIGSAGGLHGRWAPARRYVQGILFEPREDGVVRTEGRDTIYPIALADAPGQATLHVTAMANMSSTLAPNAELLSRFRKKGPHAAVVETLDLAVDTLDHVCARDGRTVDAVKVDTQGSELIILKGAEHALATSVLLAEVEFSFLERYRGQPLAADMLSYMASKGFELIEIQRPKRYRAKNRSNVANLSFGGGQRAGRIAYADGIFFLREDLLLERLAGLPADQAETVALRAMALLILYGKFDLAARLFDLTESSLDAGRRDALGRWFRSLGRRKLRFSVARRVVDYLARHV